MQVNVMFARFPGGNAEHPDTTDWLVETVLKAKADPRVSEIMPWRISDTPITMGRNRCLKVAKEQGMDIVVMVDSDMTPDAYFGKFPGAKPFWETSFEFMLAHHGPCAIAAPYCGPPPNESIYVFHWDNWQSDHKDADFQLNQYTRIEAASMGGIQEAAALPTGLFMLDMRAIKVLKPPYFYYEYTDEYETDKASTEDVTFTRDLALAGVKQYCNWDAWAGHNKLKMVGRPIPTSVDAVRDSFREAIQNNYKPHMRLMDVKAGQGLKSLLVKNGDH